MAQVAERLSSKYEAELEPSTVKKKKKKRSSPPDYLIRLHCRAVLQLFPF
jgi:hypothetical protein